MQPSTTSHDGRIEVGAGDELRFTGQTGSFQNIGTIAVEGGEIEIAQTVNNSVEGPIAGEISLRNGVARFTAPVTFNPQLTNEGILASTGGVNDLYGRISNTGAGKIAVTNQSVLIFHDDVTAEQGVITVFPGSSAIFLEDLIVNANATLLADLAGTNADTGFGQIEVVGAAQLGGGSLQVSLAEGFTPALGDSFPLLASAGGIQGTLSLTQMPPLPPGMTWDLDIDAHQVVLNVIVPLAGDYNHDNAVDAADYTVWRDTLGSESVLAADGDGDNRVDQDDYDVWKANFGAVTGSGSGAASLAVPEPASFIILTLGMTFLLAPQRRRDRT